MTTRIPLTGPFVVDAEHLLRQRAFSDATFGPGARTAGVLDHLRKELIEVEEHPDDLSEWADLIILAFDGATRRGHTPQAVLDAVLAKQVRNESRTWPDWRTQPLDKAIEHVRATADRPRAVAVPAVRCPECATGKHGNCDGEALDTTTDQFVPCPCAASDHGRSNTVGDVGPDHSSDECSYELCSYCGCCAHGKPRASGCPVTATPSGMRCPNVDCGCEGQA